MFRTDPARHGQTTTLLTLITAFFATLGREPDTAVLWLTTTLCALFALYVPSGMPGL